MLLYKSTPSLALQKLGKVVTPELNKCTKKTTIWTKFVSDSRKNGNSTNCFGSTSFAMGKRFQRNFLKKTLSKMQVVNDSEERAFYWLKPITIN